MNKKTQMKKIALAIFLIFSFSFLNAQTEELLIKSGNKGLYVDHKVTAKENFYSIGRLFNVHPKWLAAYNALDMSKGLSLGQIVKIPLSDTNFNQKSNQGAAIFYEVGEKQELTKISNANNKVDVDNLKQWNHLTADNVNKGSKLIVGFLSSNEMKNSVKTEPVIVKEDKSLVKNEEAKEIQKEEPKETVKKEPAKPDIKIDETKEEPKEGPKKSDIIQVKEEMKPAETKQGYFKADFEQQTKQKAAKKTETVTSAIFKTASGWTDGKYYVLADGIEPGTIIRITNPSNNKIIYAKVLGENEIKQGSAIRISNAAADGLEITETDKFILKINY
jgi:LysM repeat protein